MVPADVAERTASRWFSEFALGKVDADGCFVWDGTAFAGEDAPGDASLNALIVTDPGLSRTDRELAERAFWAGLSVRERVELLMQFSALHFSLLALVSDELFERMRTARGLTREQAEHNREQTRRAVAVVGGQ